MQAQQQVRHTATPVTTAFVLVATLALGTFGGFAIATAVRTPAAIPLVQRVVPQSSGRTDSSISPPRGSTACKGRQCSNRAVRTRGRCRGNFQITSDFDEEMCKYDVKI